MQPMAIAGARSCRSLVALVAACGPGIVHATQTLGQADPVTNVTVEQIVKAWNARHDRIHSLRFQFTDETVMVRKNVTLQRDLEVVVDGERLRIERRGTEWDLRAKAVLPQHLVVLYDGRQEKTYFGYDVANDRVHPVGFVDPAVGEKAPISDATSNYVWAIFHTFRIRQPRFVRSDASAWRLTGRIGTVNGHACPILEQVKFARSGHMYHVWVDPQRDFVVLRYQTGARGDVFWDLSIEYTKDPSGEWVPSRWVNHYYAEDKAGRPLLSETSTYTVTDYALNPVIDDSAFELEFPAGTVVADSTLTDASGKPGLHLVRDSDVRPITEEERLRGARYSDFLTTESGEALLPHYDGWFRWWWLAMAAVIAAAGWLMLKARRTT